MDTQGTVVVRLSTSSARIPLQGATVTITKRLPNGNAQLLAVRVTNFDGLTDPVAIETPPMAVCDGRKPELPEYLRPLRRH